MLAGYFTRGLEARREERAAREKGDIVEALQLQATKRALYVVISLLAVGFIGVLFLSYFVYAVLIQQ